ncbi:hypothetical protein [Paenibacillus agri]|uniref:Uncharacterized protein n=1 Tax=Paenibacillus agri TaxID=2744309 RepID=A0A850EP99_9BACL|nr:hypothetical protein [Paenibacillus agri]NUU61590.1 hypothetical protein [Paenibacillus agri]
MLILMEGLPGAGKSTNSGLLFRQFERHGFKTRWVHEVDRPHPVLFFQESHLKMNEYLNWKTRHNLSTSLIDKVATIREESVGFDLLELSWNHREALSEMAFNELQEKDVWKFSLDEYIEAALEKWRFFAKAVAADPEQVVILDSCIFQYQIFSFQLANAPQQQLDYFIEALWECLTPLSPKLVYLYRNSITDAISHLRQVRGESFFLNIWERDRLRPYYKARPDKVETYFEFLADYHAIAQQLYNKANCPKLSIEVTSGEWNEFEERMLAFFGLTRLPDIDAGIYEGDYLNNDLGLLLKIKQDTDQYFLIDPNGSKHKLIARTSTEFYINDLPVILNISREGEIEIDGASLTSRWTEKGLVFLRE